MTPPEFLILMADGRSMTLAEFTAAMSIKDCPVKFEIREKDCESLPEFGSDFNNTAEPARYKWHGTVEQFIEWGNTGFGAMTIYEARKQSPVIVVFPDGTWARIG